jgi:4-carboxymuconolactone decarboxylase
MSPDPTAQRRKDLAVMSQVYGWTVEDGPGEFWAHTADRLFADVWSREGLSMRDRRLLLTGALSATGQIDIAEIPAGAALRNAELDGDELVESALFLCYYIRWPANRHPAEHDDRRGDQETRSVDLGVKVSS